jgi:hypothetical protein
MTGCTKYGMSCRFDFRLSVEQFRMALRRAEQYAAYKGKDLFGVASYPYVWTYEEAFLRIRMEMGRNEHGKQVIAIFKLEPDQMQPGVAVHVMVYIMQDPENPSWSAIPTNLQTYHLVAMNHFRGCLLGIPIISMIVPQVAPSLSTELPPPPPDYEDVL